MRLALTKRVPQLPVPGVAEKSIRVNQNFTDQFFSFWRFKREDNQQKSLISVYWSTERLLPVKMLLDRCTSLMVWRRQCKLAAVREGFPVELKEVLICWVM